MNNSEALRNRLSAEGRKRAVSRWQLGGLYVDRLVDTFEAVVSGR